MNSQCMDVAKEVNNKRAKYEFIQSCRNIPLCEPIMKLIIDPTSTIKSMMQNGFFANLSLPMTPRYLNMSINRNNWSDRK